MTPEEQYRLEMETLQEVLDRPADQRNGVIEARCEGNPDLATRIRQLLDAHVDSASIWRTPPTDLLDATSHDVLCGRFELIKRLGEGGMGVVWSAHDQNLDEHIAIKLIRPEVAMQLEAILRFKQELQLARKIGHPNVCRVYELFEDHQAGLKRWFLTMELLDGCTLSQRLRSQGSVTGAESRQILRGILAGLAAAHQLGIVHRDLKPSNVMLVGNSLEIRAVVTDFGLAKRLTPDSTGITVSVFGTPAYMAPEQIAGEPATPASDIYAFGLTAIEMLTVGKGPNQETSPPLGLRTPNWALVTQNSDPRTVNLLKRCLRKNPSERFITATEALSDWDNTTSSSLGSIGFRLAPPHRILKLLIGAIGILALAGGFWAWNLHLREPPTDAQVWYREGLQSLAEGAIIRARGEFEKSAELAPRFAAALAGKAEALLEMDMTAQSRDAMLQASEAAPDRSRLPLDQAYYLQGISRLVMGDCAPALESLKKMTEQSPQLTRPGAVLVRARALIRCNQPKVAESVLGESALLDSRNAAIPMLRALLAARRRDYYSAGDLLKKAEDLYRLRDQREGMGQVLLYRAVFLEEQNRLDEATQALDQAFDIARTSPNPLLRVRVLLERGLVLRQRGDMASAEQQTASAMQLANQSGLDTLSLQALFAAGNIHLKRYELSLAENQFIRALDIAERFRNQESIARAQLSLGSVYVSTGQADKAIQTIQAAMPFFERAGLVRNVVTGNLLVGQALIINNEFVEAEKILSTQLEYARKAQDVEREAVVRETLATAQAELGDIPTALENYESTLKIHKAAGKKRSLVYALSNASDMQSRLGRFQAAAANLAEARRVASEIEKDPADLYQRVAMAAAVNALRSGNYNAAISASKDALRPLLSQSGSRQTQLEAVLCNAIAMTPQRSAAPAHCEKALKLAQSAGRQAKFDAQLLAAQAYLQTGSPKEALANSALVAEELAKRKCPEGSWRAYVISANASNSLGQLEEAKMFYREASRQLEFFRIKISGQDFDHWLKRADVRLFKDQLPQAKERMNQ